VSQEEWDTRRRMLFDSWVEADPRYLHSPDTWWQEDYTRKSWEETARKYGPRPEQSAGEKRLGLIVTGLMVVAVVHSAFTHARDGILSAWHWAFGRADGR
jgi:hypothetical protein